MAKRRKPGSRAFPALTSWFPVGRRGLTNTFTTKHHVGTSLCVSGSPGPDRMLFLSSPANRPVGMLIRNNPNKSSMKLFLWSLPRSGKKRIHFTKTPWKSPTKASPSLVSAHCQHVSSNMRRVSCFGKEKRREMNAIDLWCIKTPEENTQTPSKLAALSVLTVFVPNKVV